MCPAKWSSGIASCAAGGRSVNPGISAGSSGRGIVVVSSSGDGSF